MPRVSVLMPTYNRAATIERAVKTVFGQQTATGDAFDDWELVIYDDGSDDDDGTTIIKGARVRVCPPTAKVLKPYLSDARVRLCGTRVNGGVAAARNALMEQAKGDYLCWLDSDDMMNRYRLALCLDAMQTYAPSYVRSAATTFGQEDKGWIRPPVLLWRGGVSVATVMFPCDKPLAYDTRFTYVCEDMDWECRYAAEYGSGMHIPLALYCIGRRTPHRLSMKHKDEECLEAVRADKALHEHKQAAAVARMAARGYQKRPRPLPYEHLTRYLQRWYRKWYGVS